MYYTYRVEFITDYQVIQTTVALMLDDNTGNTSDEAREQAIIEADASVEYETGSKIAHRAYETRVTLLLDDNTELELEDN